MQFSFFVKALVLSPSSFSGHLRNNSSTKHIAPLSNTSDKNLSSTSPAFIFSTTKSAYCTVSLNQARKSNSSSPTKGSSCSSPTLSAASATLPANPG
ncbi:hypothetical protein MtrunA17_Chr7g0264061 [Medicago truncatula]|uniref:Uncharacterized protein n=1 Tax=Medicago truncatula TaxID=3880 RepID=A0A396H6R7_MEDTR|nr:hypothetical protein MtrunA17_Chr7g0264061 [Medicago truncatula]